MSIPNEMRAVVIERFGGPEELKLGSIPIPEIGPREVLVNVEYAGVGVWDTFERKGGYAEMLGLKPEFPYVLGSEGAGTVAALGDEVTGFQIGDKVYAAGFLNPKGGFYAEYAAVDAGHVSIIPAGMPLREASAILGVGLTALRGIQDILQLREGESIMIAGASGGIGHLAAQLADRIGARVFAMASGEDGTAVVRKLITGTAIDGRREDWMAAARQFAPQGFDAALLTFGGGQAEAAVQYVRKGGRIAYPNGIHPEPQARPDKTINGYNGDPDPEIIQQLDSFIRAGVTVHIAHTFELKDAAACHAALEQHYPGKICLRIT
ncbi:quinone oxidoreductase family protein [Paenibacillus tarimensis]|uniref:quinone oxidoreductase family protein n=1 Tax=Paenibacillus tarimensis TaxID=416012 RepID=UPI001F42957A|nr:NADP-dependent oxidoreductase [Paenibacillus tarimensis]MCF2945142.1 NADP-dependent oxidoreductase [Paenibacillus tarimensis]